MEYQPSDMSVPCDSGIINLRVGAIIVKENKIPLFKKSTLCHRQIPKCPVKHLYVLTMIPSLVQLTKTPVWMKE